MWHVIYAFEAKKDDVLFLTNENKIKGMKAINIKPICNKKQNSLLKAQPMCFLICLFLRKDNNKNQSKKLK